MLSRNSALRNQGNDSENQAPADRDGTGNTERRDGRSDSSAGETNESAGGINLESEIDFNPNSLTDTDKWQHSHAWRGAEGGEQGPGVDADRVGGERARNATPPSRGYAAVHETQTALYMHERAWSMWGSSRRKWEWL